MRCHTVRLLVMLALGILTTPLAANAQQMGKVPRIGVLVLGSPPFPPDWKQRSPFLQELHHLGWIEGQNIAFEYRWAEGRSGQLPDLAAELVRLHVDVIVVEDTPALWAVKQATTTIPIV